MKGLTGTVGFDNEAGVRSNFSLDVVQLVDDVDVVDLGGLKKLGSWSPDGFTTAGVDSRPRTPPSIKNQNLIVTTLIVSCQPRVIRVGLS